MVRWDTPNFFDLCGVGLTGFRSLENLRWVSEGIEGYKDLFNGFDCDITKYITCGFQIFDKSHKQFVLELKDFYYKNNDEILRLQKSVGKGTDQTVYNYLLQINNIKVGKLPAPYLLTHMNRFDWFSHNWQLKEDKTPFFIKYGYIWMYSGFDRTQRFGLMKQTWDLVKNNYE